MGILQEEGGIRWGVGPCDKVRSITVTVQFVTPNRASAVAHCHHLAAYCQVNVGPSSNFGASVAMSLIQP